MGDPQPSACPLTPSQSEVGAECRAVASACLVLPSEPEVSGGWGRKQASFLRVGDAVMHKTDEVSGLEIQWAGAISVDVWHSDNVREP